MQEAQPNSARPLLGKTVMITRARAQAAGLARKIEDLGGAVIECATIRIDPPESYDALDAAIEHIHDYDWLIFTSVNGVEQFLARAERFHRTAGDLNGIRLAAIGPETAGRLKSAGISDCLIPHRFRAEGLLDALGPESVRNKKVLIPRAAKARDILPETLRDWGADVNVVDAYRTGAPSADTAEVKNLLRRRRVDVITFTSSSTVTNFAGLLPGEKLRDILAGVAIACIGPITQQTVEELGGHVDVVAEEFTIDGLIRALVDYFAPSGAAGATVRAERFKR
jgi:uroporphyrinogen III methyltransferase/synthase